MRTHLGQDDDGGEKPDWGNALPAFGWQWRHRIERERKASYEEQRKKTLRRWEKYSIMRSTALKDRLNKRVWARKRDSLRVRKNERKRERALGPWGLSIPKAMTHKVGRKLRLKKQQEKHIFQNIEFNSATASKEFSSMSLKLTKKNDLPVVEVNLTSKADSKHSLRSRDLLAA